VRVLALHDAAAFIIAGLDPAIHLLI